MRWRAGNEKTAGESNGGACSEFELYLVLLAAGDVERRGLNWTLSSKRS
jgi:hypothetical protein